MEMATMVEARFTPGPWTVSAPQPNFGGDQFVYGADRVTVARVQVMHRATDEERQATAELIAAAPDLFDALSSVNKLISEAAMTGFNWQDGDWAQRLFESQRQTSAALLRASPSSERKLEGGE